jgi:hypothetical protein
MDETTSALITGGTAVASQAINAYATERANKKNRKFAQEMYEKQQADNLKSWNMTNTYNSPQEQMKRLQEAGLNPNLIYGSGSQTGGTASPTTAPQASFKASAPQFDLGGATGSAFDRYFNTQLKTAQLDNLKKQNDAIEADIAYKNAQIQGTDLDNQLKSGGLTDSLQYLTQRNSEMGSRAVVRANEAEIINQMKPTTIQMGLEKLIQMRQGRALSNEQINKLKNDQEVQRMNIDLMKNGLSPNDPAYLRILGRLAAQMGINIK